MKILSVCLIIITLFVTMTIQYNYQAYPNKYRRQFNNEYNPYYNKYDNNKGKNYDDTTTTTNNNDNNNNNDNYNYGYNRKPGNNYPYKMYPNKKPNKIPLTRKYIMEGEAKHIHQKHGEKHIKAVGELFGFTDTYQGSDYELTTTFHKGSISTKSGKPKYFSTYDTEGLMKHYQNTHGRAKFNLNAKSHGHEKYKDQKEMKATVTFENNDNTIDDESNYSPTSHPYGKLEGY
uniref:Trematode Eggshell Synthesis domain containing protein n=1 Tax=Schistosoma mansoni TaxID=6183 RepID=A0A5K4F9D1_SCHMA